MGKYIDGISIDISFQFIITNMISTNDLDFVCGPSEINKIKLICV